MGSYGDFLRQAPSSSPAPAAAPAPSFGESAAQGFIDFATLNYGDELEASLRSRFGGEDYDTAVADVRQRQESAGGLPYYLGAAGALLTPGGIGTLTGKAVQAAAPAAARLFGQRAAPWAAAGAVGAAEGGAAAVGGSQGDVGQRLQAAPAGAAMGVAGGVAGEAIGRGLSRFGNRMLAGDIGEMNPLDVQELQRLAQARGIQLTPAELTGMSSLAQEQKLLGNTPGASEIMDRFYRQRAQSQIEPAVEGFLDQVAPAAGLDDATASFQAAAKQGFQRIAEERAAKASPIYQRAFASGDRVNVKPVLKAIADTKQRFPADGKINRTLGSIEKLLTVKVPRDQPDVMEILGEISGGKPLPERLPMDDLQVLHGAKLEIDDLIAQARVKADKGGGKTVISVLGDVQASLLRQMDRASNDYRVARGIFSDLSPGVDQVREGVAGTILRLQGSGTRLAAGKLFEKSNATLTETLKAKKLVKGEDPDAWNAISRAWLEEKWIKATQQRGATDADPVNAGAVFRREVMGNRKQRELVRAMLEPDQFTALDQMSQVLAAAGRVKPLGSDTAWNQEAQKAMRRKGRSLLGQLVGAANPFVLREVAAYMDQIGYERYTKQLAEVVTSPNGIELMKELKQLSPHEEFQRAVIGYAAGMGSAIGLQGGGANEQPNAQILPAGGLGQPGGPGLAAVAGPAPAPQASAPGNPDNAGIAQELAALRSLVAGSQGGSGAAPPAPQMSPEELALRREELRMRQVEAKERLERENQLMQQQMALLRELADRRAPRGGGRKRIVTRRDELGHLVGEILEDVE